MSLSKRPRLGDTVVLFRGIFFFFFFPTGGSRHRFRPAVMLAGSERGMRLTPGVMGGEVTPALQTATAALIHSFIYVSIYSVRLEGWNKRRGRQKFGSLLSQTGFYSDLSDRFRNGKISLSSTRRGSGLWVLLQGHLHEHVAAGGRRYNSTSCWSFPNN